MQLGSFRLSIVASPVVLTCGLLMLGASAKADWRDSGCSNRTLRGDYGASVEGWVLPGPGVALPIRGVVMTHYDGNGNFTQVDHIVVNGAPPATQWTPGTGTYQLNADCTGTATINPSTGGFVNLMIVVVNQGKTIHAVVTAPYDGPDRTVTSVSHKVE